MAVVRVNAYGIMLPARCVACYGAPVTEHMKVSGGGAKVFVDVRFPLCADCTAAMRAVQPKGEIHHGLGLHMMHGNITEEQWQRASRVSDSVSVSVENKGFLSHDKVLVAKFANEDFAAEFQRTNAFYQDPKVQAAAAAYMQQQRKLQAAANAAAKAAARGKK